MTCSLQYWQKSHSKHLHLLWQLTVYSITYFWYCSSQDLTEMSFTITPGQSLPGNSLSTLRRRHTFCFSSGHRTINYSTVLSLHGLHCLQCSLGAGSRSSWGNGIYFLLPKALPIPWGFFELDQLCSWDKTRKPSVGLRS